MKNQKALILAGGFGTRLQTVVSDVPKPMAPVNGKPFLEYQISLLKKFGIQEIVLSVGFKADIISKYFKDGAKFFVHIKYSKEDSPLGTGGAIRKALPMLGDNFLVLNGDSIILADLNALVDFHLSNNSDITMLLARKENAKRYGSIIIDDKNRITNFVEKNMNDNASLINAGVYVIRKNSVEWEKTNESFSFEKDLFPTLVGKKRLYGYVSEDYFIDIGIPEDYFEIQKSGSEMITQYLKD